MWKDDRDAANTLSSSRLDKGASDTPDLRIRAGRAASRSSVRGGYRRAGRFGTSSQGEPVRASQYDAPRWTGRGRGWRHRRSERFGRARTRAVPEARSERPNRLPADVGAVPGAGGGALPAVGLPAHRVGRDPDDPRCVGPLTGGRDRTRDRGARRDVGAHALRDPEQPDPRQRPSTGCGASSGSSGPDDRTAKLRRRMVRPYGPAAWCSENEVRYRVEWLAHLEALRGEAGTDPEDS